MVGIPNVIAMIGLYGFAEALLQASKKEQVVIRQNVDKILPEFGLVKKHFGLTMRCSIIGTIIGAVQNGVLNLLLNLWSMVFWFLT